jgi:hypothetical protein
MVKAYMLTKLKTGNPDIVRIGPTKDSCIVNRHRYVTVGVDEEFGECAFTNTDNISTYLLAEPAAPRAIAPGEKGKTAYLGICAGRHTFTGRMIGLLVQIIQALYMDNPEDLAVYIAAPVKKRDDYPEMPPQNYLDEKTRLALRKIHA